MPNAPRERAPQPARERKHDSLATRARLLQAAGEVFAEYGFRRARVEEICQRAKTNIGAINYHFGSKEALYAEVFRWVRDSTPEGSTVPEISPALPAEARLRAVIRANLAGALSEGRPAWQEILIARELADPTGSLRQVFSQEVRTRLERMMGILNELGGGKVEPERLARSAFSVAGQCLFYRMALTLIRDLYPERKEFEDPDLAADHIAAFTVAAMRGGGH